MAHTLYKEYSHEVTAFYDLVTGDGVQSNQFLIVHDGHSILLDPGGALTYTALSMELSKRMKLKDLDYVFASHQDPDIITSIDRWLGYTNAKIICPRIWVRFLPHLIPSYRKDSYADRIVGIPDQGENLVLGNMRLKILPAHFLHSVGNLQVYDPVSRILFSGDMGASIIDRDGHLPVEDFAAHIPSMLGFHRRYMAANKVCQLWVNMVRGLNVEMIVPQHGRPFKGQAMVKQFLNWIEALECGVDLLTQGNYQVP